LANSECSTAEPPPFHGSNEEELRACAKCFADHIVISSLQASLDDIPLEQLGDYRTASPLFTFDYPDENIFGIPDGPEKAKSVSDGYWILLRPLSAGQHTLSFSGSFAFSPGDDCGQGIDQPLSLGFSASYVLTVKGEK
jgi:hypothetical protein